MQTSGRNILIIHAQIRGSYLLLCALMGSYVQTCGHNILFIHAHVTDSGLGASWRAA